MCIYIYNLSLILNHQPKKVDPPLFVGIWMGRIETTVVQAVDRLKPIEVIEVQSGTGSKIQDFSKTFPAILNPGSAD